MEQFSVASEIHRLHDSIQEGLKRDEAVYLKLERLTAMLKNRNIGALTESSVLVENNTSHREEELKRSAPLAERLRPRNLDDFVGQSAILAEGRLLRRAIAADRVGNLLLHGPPGVGKTTIFNIITGLVSPDFGSIYINSP